MVIKVIRKNKLDTATLGEVYFGDEKERFCYSLEDRIQSGEKVYGKTAIPTGKYEIVLSFSNRFKKILPEILNVPGFRGVRIHGGNTELDTLGCILVGAKQDLANKKIYDCAGCVKAIIDVLSAHSKEKNWIEII